MNAREVFVRNLNHYMQIRGKDQADIVSTLGVSASTVSDWVKGKKYPRVDAMQRLADLLGVLMSDLTAESTDQNDIQLSDIQFALMSESKDLTDEQLQEVLNFARFVAQNKKKDT